MITSHVVGAVFEIEDRATRVLERISEGLDRLEEQVSRVRGLFAAFGEADWFGNLNTQLTATAEKINAIAASAERMRGAMAMPGYTGTMADVDRLIEGAARGSLGGGGGGGSHRGSAASPEMQELQRQLRQVNLQIEAMGILKDLERQDEAERREADRQDAAVARQERAIDREREKAQRQQNLERNKRISDEEAAFAQRDLEDRKNRAKLEQAYDKHVRETQLWQNEEAAFHAAGGFSQLDDGLTIPEPPRGARTSFYESRTRLLGPPPIVPPFVDEGPGRGPRRPIGEGIEARLLGLRGLTIGAGAFIAGSESLHEDMAIRQIEKMFGVPDSQLAQYAPQLYGIMRQSAQGTIYSERETAAAGAKAAQTLAFSVPELANPRGLAAFGKVLPIILRGAETGQQLGLGPLEENIQALTMYAHLTNRWDPEALTQGANKFLALALRTGMPMEELEKTMAQGIPMAVGAGADIDETAALVGFLSRAGLGRRAGYAVGQMILGTLPSGGPMSSQMTHYGADLRQALHLTGHGAGRAAHPTKHDFWLRQTGLVDEHDHSTVWSGPDDAFDIDKFFQVMHHFDQTHTKEQREEAYRNIFNIRGLRGMALTDMEKLMQFGTSLSNVPDIKSLQSSLAQSPLYQLEQIWARLKDIGNTMMTSILPGFEILERGLLTVVTGIDNFLTHHPAMAAILTSASVGAIGGALLGGPGGAAIGALGGAAAGAAATAHTLLPHHPQSTHPQGMFPPLPAPGHLTPHAGQKVGSLETHIHVASLHIHGAPGDADEAWGHRIFAKLAEAADRARSHNTGLGLGSFGSPYDAGAVA